MSHDSTDVLATVWTDNVGAGFKPAPTDERAIHESAHRNRRSIRLQGYDYSQAGAYFVTICTRNRECLFGEIVNGDMRLNDAGSVVESVWDGLPGHYAHVELDAMVIMPNHFHGIIVLAPVGVGAGNVRAGFKPAPTPAAMRHGLSEIVRALKTFSSRRINESRQTPGTKLWQRNYWEHIIRNESELNRIREYIHNNPTQWEMDKLHPNNPVGAGFKPAPTQPARTEIREPITEYCVEAWMA
jgi:REP element-mobilizing transposase RayT